MMTNPMPPPDPRDGVQRDAQNRPICGARTRDGGSCKQPAMRGGLRCRMHGGASPQARRAAKLRLASLVDPAIATLGRVLVTAKRDQDKLRAAGMILDRAGHPAATRIDASISVEDSRELLLERLLEKRAEPAAAPPLAPPLEVLEAEVIDEVDGDER